MLRQNNAEGGNRSPPPALIGCDELQLVIPGRVGLHQSPPPLHQPADSMRYSRPARREFFSERQPVSYSPVSPQGSTPITSHYAVGGVTTGIDGNITKGQTFTVSSRNGNGTGMARLSCGLCAAVKGRWLRRLIVHLSPHFSEIPKSRVGSSCPFSPDVFERGPARATRVY